MNNGHTYHRIGFSHQEDFVFVSPGEIIFIQSIHNNCLVYSTLQKSPFIIFISLQEVINRIPEVYFCRVHKSFIVSLEHIKKMNKEKTRLFYQDNKIVPIGRSYLQPFLEKVIMLR
ncbi:MAG: LytTR family DNA-binding domain-containing protein [Flavitalea sp.]